MIREVVAGDRRHHHRRRQRHRRLQRRQRTGDRRRAERPHRRRHRRGGRPVHRRLRQQRDPRGGQGDRRHHHRRRQRHRRLQRRRRPATAAELDDPDGVAVDSAGDLFITDCGKQRGPRGGQGDRRHHHRRRRRHAGYSGDDGPATAAELDQPLRVAVDSAGDVFIADGNNVVREFSPAAIVNIDQAPNIQSLNVNQPTTGNIPSPYSIDEWTFLKPRPIPRCGSSCYPSWPAG